MNDKRRPVRLVKKFKWGDKVIYEGILRKALRMIPESKKSQYQIIFLDEESPNNSRGQS